MDAQQIELIRESWASVASEPDLTAGEFFVTLFSMDPRLMPVLSRPDMEEQGRRLMRAVGTVVESLDELPQILPFLERFGRQHIPGVARPEHFDMVGASLMETLEGALGDGFTDAHREAWGTAYSLMAEAVKAAADDVLVA